MTKLTLEQQELLFSNDCKLINLRYEYHGYTGSEKWAIVTELAEEELWVKYPVLPVVSFFRQEQPNKRASGREISERKPFSMLNKWLCYIAEYP